MANPLKWILPDVTEEWYDVGEEICSTYCKEYESREMTKTFEKAAWLRYINSEEGYFELPLLEAYNELVNPRQSPRQLDDAEVNANIAVGVDEEQTDAVSDHDDHCYFESAAGIDEVKCIGVERCF